jgi:SWI/SNF-related matrix-associated actin-dependent regulator 1 of chromatin subfamily A
MAEEYGDISTSNSNNAEALVKIEKLKQLAVKAKLPAVVKWVEDFLDSDEKLVTFATHINTLDRLEDKFKSISVRIDGGTSNTIRKDGSSKRNELVHEFQDNPKTRILLGNIKAAGVGLNLTAASSVAIIELPWTPAEVDQAVDRCHRIGQKDTVNAYFLLVKGTIEEEIANLLDSKRITITSILDGTTPEATTLFQELLKKYQRRK